VISIRDSEFKVVGVGRNLRIVMDRSRRIKIERVDIWPGKSEGAQVGVAWVDGSSSIFDFADAGIAKKFFESRVKRLGWPQPKIHLPRSA